MCLFLWIDYRRSVHLEFYEEIYCIISGPAMCHMIMRNSKISKCSHRLDHAYSLNAVDDVVRVTDETVDLSTAPYIFNIAWVNVPLVIANEANNWIVPLYFFFSCMLGMLSIIIALILCHLQWNEMMFVAWSMWHEKCAWRRRQVHCYAL